MSGHVVRVGAQVDGWAPGDAVTVRWAVPASALIRLPDALALDCSALVERTRSPCATGAGLP